MQQDERRSGEHPDADAGAIDRPRLTPQGRADPDAEGTDATAPAGAGAKQGQPDKPEG